MPKAKFGKCVVCDEPIGEKRYWSAMSRGFKPRTCGRDHQILLNVRESRGLDEKGNKLAPARGKSGK